MLLYYLADINYVTGSPTQVQPNGKEGNLTHQKDSMCWFQKYFRFVSANYIVFALFYI